jgi:uracil-DNA glycosylase family protein
MRHSPIYGEIPRPVAFGFKSHTLANYSLPKSQYSSFQSGHSAVDSLKCVAAPRYANCDAMYLPKGDNGLSYAVMRQTLPTAAAFLPERHDLTSLREAARHCEGCPLYAKATQTVFGSGPARAEVVMVGEQPGDVEDRQGKPFVGPAGRLLDRLMEEAGIDRQRVYVTNAVKHFKWTPRGKRRLHSKPSSREIFACRPWLEAELEAIKPELLVLLGATAAQSLLGAQFRITKNRGQPTQTEWAPWTMATYHPSALLRSIDQPGEDQLRSEFVADLKLVARKLAQLK